MGEPTIDKPSIDRLDIADPAKSSGTDDLSTSAINIQAEGDEITSALPADDMFPMTHSDGFAILNEFFEQPAISSGLVSDMEGLGKWPAFTAESTHRDEIHEHIVWSNTPKVSNALHYSPSTALNLASPKALDMLDTELPIASAATSEDGSSGSSEIGSLSIDRTSYPPSETHRFDSDLATIVRHTPYIKRLVLDKSAQWLDHVLIALH
jgi:hypothetical protein